MPDLAGFVNIHGQPINPHSKSFETRKAAPRDGLKATTDRASAKESQGFRVVGHPPGALEESRDWTQKVRTRWMELSEEARAVKLREGQREPKEWDEAAWRANTKGVAVRSKPYEIESAARTCAEMATKAGWLDVRVIELLKG